MSDLSAPFPVIFSNKYPVQLICFKMVQCNWRVGRNDDLSFRSSIPDKLHDLPELMGVHTKLWLFKKDQR